MVKTQYGYDCEPQSSNHFPALPLTRSALNHTNVCLFLEVRNGQISAILHGSM